MDARFAERADLSTSIAEGRARPMADGDQRRFASAARQGASSCRFDKVYQRCIDEFISMCSADPRALEVFIGVTQSTKSPTAMFAPTLALRVMRRLIRREPPQGKASDPIPVFKPAK